MIGKRTAKQGATARRTLEERREIAERHLNYIAILLHVLGEGNNRIRITSENPAATHAINLIFLGRVAFSVVVGKNYRRPRSLDNPVNLFAQDADRT